MKFTVVRLQVQREPLKPGKAPLREYRPEPITAVSELRVEPRGAHGIGPDGEVILDVHHQDHPRTRNPKGRGGLTFLGTQDYVALRERYGPHLADGIAGESILVDGAVAGRTIPLTVVLRTRDGELLLEQVRVADPCVEFTRFCLRRGPDTPVDDAVRQGLKDLDNGARGYRAVPAAVGLIGIGDTLGWT